MKDGKMVLIAHHLLESSIGAYIEWLVNELMMTVSASSPLVGFGELNDNTIKGLTRKELKETQSLCGNLNNVDIGKP